MYLPSLLQTHYHFAEHRQKLVKAVEEIITSDYKSVPSHKLQIPSPRQKYRSTLGASTNSMGKPPKHTQKVTLSPTGSYNSSLSCACVIWFSHYQKVLTLNLSWIARYQWIPMKGLHLRGGDGKRSYWEGGELGCRWPIYCVCLLCLLSDISDMYTVYVFLHSDTSITSSSEEISTKDKEQNIPTVIITAGVNNPTPRARLEMAQEQSTITKVNDSWDRYVRTYYQYCMHTLMCNLVHFSDDSIEELDPPHNGRTSSTPIKVSVGNYS